MNDQIQRNRSALYQCVAESLSLWPVPDDAAIDLINISENATFLISAADGYKTVLRVHRPDYHDRATIAAELTWMAELNRTGIIHTPAIIPGHDGSLIQRHQIPGQPPHDMRLANLLVEGNDMRRVHVIDFDDCGFGRFMYDFAAGISFIEDDPQIPQLRSAWLEGYQEQRPLTGEDVMMVDTMIMLRRMLLLAWIGSHKDADIVAGLEKDFGRITVMLAERYLADANHAF